MSITQIALTLSSVNFGVARWRTVDTRSEFSLATPISVEGTMIFRNSTVALV